MPAELISTLIEAGIAGVFAVFAILLYKESTKTLHATQKMFIESIEAEREQRAKIMMMANQHLRDLAEAVERMNAAAGVPKPREKTKPRAD